MINHIYLISIADGANLRLESRLNSAKAAQSRVLRRRANWDIQERPEHQRQKFPVNSTRSYRSTASLKIICGIAHWTRLTLEPLQVSRVRLTAPHSDERGETINSRDATRILCSSP